MDVRYVSQNLEWTKTLRNQVEDRLLARLSRHLGYDECELVLRLERDSRRPESLEMWAFLQTFDGRHNEIVRCEGHDPHELIEEIADLLLSKVVRVNKPSRLFNNPFDFLIERTA